MLRWLGALLLSLWLGCAAHGAVAVLNNPGTDHAQNSLGTNTYSFAMSSGSNLGLAALVTWDNTGGVTVSSVVWDSGGTNQTMTAITGATSTNGACSAQLFGLVGSITTGTKNLVATFTGGGGTTNSYVSAISFTGVDQTGGATSFPNGTSATGTGTAASVTITSATGDAVVGDGCDTSSATNTVGQTVVYEDHSGLTNNGWGNEAAGASTVNLTATLASTTWSYAGTDVKAAATACNSLALLGVGC